MKKNITFVLALVFVLSLALIIQARAEDNVATGTILTTVSPTTTTTPTYISTPTPTSTVEITTVIPTPVTDSTIAPVTTSTPVIITVNPEPRSTVGLEKIPSLDYLKYFREVIKKDGVMYGIRMTKNEISSQPTIKVEEKKATTSLEKISSPDQIKFFERITKIGTTLFGVKKITSTSEIAKPEVKKTEINKNELEKKLADIRKIGLEKISSLQDLKFFEKVTKVGDDLFGIRKNTPNILPVMSTTTVECVSTVIDAKDTKIVSAINAASAEIATAITARGTCQKAVLTLETKEINTALNKCNQVFQEASKKANDTMKNVQKETWTAYRNSLKECSKNNTGTSSEIMIEDGGQNTSNVLVQ